MSSQRQADSASTLDPITFSVILSRLNSIASEMTITLERSAWTSILALSRDFSCAIYDADSAPDRDVRRAPIHTTSMQLVVGGDRQDL